jgi:tetratricopeptide (TPR) repeat protein
MIAGKTQHNGSANLQTLRLAVARASQLRDWPELLNIANSWIESESRSIEAWQALSRAHFEESRFSQALDAFEKVLQLEPENVTHKISIARLATAAGQYDCARGWLNDAESSDPDSGEVLYALSRLHYLTGELEQAENYCRRAIRAIPNLLPAYVTLGMLCEGQFDDEELAIIQQMARHPGIHPEYRTMLAFTIGDALDRRGEHEQAFAAWDHANNVNARISVQEGYVYDRQLQESEIALLHSIFDEPISVPVNTKTSECKPIFVVGMPRSGTTLIESILASHSTVTGAGELPGMQDILEELMQFARKHGALKARKLLQTNAPLWRARYLAAMPAAGAAHWVVDKQPLNYRSIGLIRVLFPESPIIHTVRSPMDVGFSIYRHKFSKNWPCAHRLDDIGHYYGVYMRTMAMWQQRCGDAIHTVEHAALVKHPKTEIRKTLDFAGLNIEPACLEPQNTKRAIATFSAVQVRRPISSQYTGRASSYTKQLSPLRQALLNAGVVPGDGINIANQ